MKNEEKMIIYVCVKIFFFFHKSKQTKKEINKHDENT